jgi:hypothetical protein
MLLELLSSFEIPLCMRCANNLIFFQKSFATILSLLHRQCKAQMRFRCSFCVSHKFIPIPLAKMTTVNGGNGDSPGDFPVFVDG